MDYVILILTGLIAGILGSIMGLGGGMIILPVLNLLLGFNPEMAIGSSLFAVVFTSLFSSLGYYRMDHVQTTPAFKMGCGGIVGVLVGSYVFSSLMNHTQILRIFMGVWFLFLAVRMGQQVYREKKGYLARRGEPFFSFHSNVALLLIGGFIGVLAGILGIGGGVIMVPILMSGFGFTPHKAVGTAFLAMLPIAIIGSLVKMTQGVVALDAGILLGIGAAVGAQLGVFFSRFITPIVLKAVFCCLFVILSYNYLV